MCECMAFIFGRRSELQSHDGISSARQNARLQPTMSVHGGGYRFIFPLRSKRCFYIGSL